MRVYHPFDDKGAREVRRRFWGTIAHASRNPKQSENPNTISTGRQLE
jgi:hypothetical protein